MPQICISHAKECDGSATFDEGGELLIGAVDGDVHVEVLFPAFAFFGAALDLGKVELELVEGFQRVEQ